MYIMLRSTGGTEDVYVYSSCPLIIEVHFVYMDLPVVSCIMVADIVQQHPHHIQHTRQQLDDQVKDADTET